MTKKLLDLPRAAAARDSVSKLFYLSLFKQIIEIMNFSLMDCSKSSCAKPNRNYIGILDIAGFESFEAGNSLEQLFINLSNETLQQFFNNYVFKSELEDYKKEDIPVGGIEFVDNLDILELIQGSTTSSTSRTLGILDLLDEELNVAKGNNETYCAKLGKSFGSGSSVPHGKFVGNKFGRPMFSIKHFAGEVEYATTGWLEKNLDEPPRETIELMANSKNIMLKLMGEGMQKRYLRSLYKVVLFFFQSSL